MTKSPMIHNEVRQILDEWKRLLQEYNKKYVYESYMDSPYMYVEVPIVEDNNDTIHNM